MSSLHPPAVEALLSQWESRTPGTPVRAVVDHAAALGFVPTPPGGAGTADYLRLVFTEQSQRAVTLYVNALRLTAAGSAARKVAATLPGAAVKSRDVQLPFDSANPFAALDTFRRVATGELVAPPGPAPVRHDSGQLEFLPATPLTPASPRSSARSSRPRVALAVVAALALLLLVAGAASGGIGGALVVLGLVALVVGAAAVVLGRARWAFIATRGVGGIVAAAGVAVLAIGSATLPPAEPASTVQAAPVAEPSIDTEAATAAAEAELVEVETDEAARTTPAPVPGLLSDSAADTAVVSAQPTTALAALGAVEVKGRAAKTGYDRDLYGSAWTDVDRNGCDTRNDVLARDLTGETTRNCVVLTGNLADPYSGKPIAFQRGQGTSEAVQIDHVVALSNSWQTGAQGWDATKRTAFANDPLNLLAVDGPLNMQKGDGDAATWLPPSKGYRCAYVARQVAVKVSYGLWMTQAERNAIATVLSTCPAEPLPGGVVAAVPAPVAAPSPAPRAAVVAPVPVPVPAPAPAPAPAVEPAPRAAVVVPAPAPAPAPSAEVYYQNCDAVRAAGAAPIHPGDPGWQPKFDRDKDGTGCDA